jgi:O-methyltransferase involved in polyketide biosynthesis
MSAVTFVGAELAAATARGVRQCVVIGSQPLLCEIFKSSTGETLEVFAVDEAPACDSPATFVPTQFAFEALAVTLKRSNFDRLKASLFVWLGAAGYRTFDAAIASLAFIASLPKGSGVIFDYAVERTSLRPLTHTALDALASRLLAAGGSVKLFIQPQAVAALLHSLGFRNIVDLAQDSPVCGHHLVTAVL